MFSASLVNSVDQQLAVGAEQVKRRLRLDELQKQDIYTLQEGMSTTRTLDTVRYIIWDANRQQPLRRSSNLVRVESSLPKFNTEQTIKYNTQEFAGRLYRTYSEYLLKESSDTEPNLALQTLMPLDDVNTEVSRLKTLFYWIIPFSVLLIFVGGWWVAGRALLPVRNLINDLHSINADRLNERVNISRRDEIGEVAAAFNFLLNRIEATFLSLKRFTADAAHQLRTPLTNIRSQSEIALSRDRDKKEYRDAFGNVVEEVDHLLHLSESLLQLARADAGLIEMSPVVVELSDLVKTWVENLMPLAEEKDITLTMEVQDKLQIHSDPLLMEAILVNLLENAINYTPQQGRIHVAVRKVEQHAEIQVCDSGPGIPNSEKERIFDRFVRLEKTRQNVYGSGLGLAIVRAAMQIHQGTVTVTDNKPTGSCFKVVLPILTKSSG